MASVEELIIKLTADNSDLKRKMADSEKSVGGLGSAIGKVGPMIAGALSVGTIISFSKAAYAANEQQEKANKRLQFALQNNQAAFKVLTMQASQFQETLGVEDDAIMQIQTLAATTGRTTKQIKDITEASIYLSKVTGQDLQSAYMQINSTFNGSAGRLTRLDAEFGTLTDEQLRNGDAVDLVRSKYRDIAEQSVSDVELMSANWGEFMENFGQTVSTVVNPALKATSLLLSNMNKSDGFIEKMKTIIMSTTVGGAVARTAELAANQIVEQAEAEKKLGDFTTKATAELEKKTSAVKIGKTALEQYISSMEDMYRKAQELSDFNVPVPTFGAMDAGVTTTTSKGITGKGGDPSKLQVRTQKEFGAAIKNTTSELQAQIGAMTQMNGIMTGFGEAAATAFGEQSMAAKAFAAGQVIAQAAVGIMGTWAGYAEFGPVGTALAIAQTAMIGGLAVTQLGKIAGAFAQGGIVGGSSFSGDRMTARVNSGEMILNGRQQQQLFAMANGGGGSQRIEIYGTLQGDAIRLSNKRSSTIAMKRGVR